MNYVELIQSVGFPITAVIAMAWYLYKQSVDQRADAKEREERMYGQLDKFGEILNNFNESLQSIDRRIETLEKK